MDGLGGYYACEISQAEKDKYCMLSLICGNRLTDLYRKLVVTSGKKEGGRGKIGLEDYEIQTTMYNK